MALPSNPIVLLVGRLSGPKNTVLLKILKEVAPQVKAAHPKALFQIAGGPVGEEHRKLERELPYIHFLGHQKKLGPHYQRATLVVGAGRVALEAMALGKPVVAIGERTYVGPLSTKNLPLAKATNFGDCLEKEDFDWDRLALDLKNLLRNESLRKETARVGTALLKSEYDLNVVEPRLNSLYEKIILQKNVSKFHEIPVLMYHRVVQTPPAFTRFNLHVTQSDLEAQFLFLKDRGFETITFEDLISRGLPPKPILLTFDDGYEDNHRFLLPLLRKHRMKAVVYLLGDRKHRTNFWDIPKGEPEATLLRPGQIMEMVKSGFVEFGAHSLNHRKLVGLKSSELTREIGGSKKALEDFLGKKVLSFAYPYGAVDEEVKKKTAQVGYTFGVAVNSGPTKFGDDLMEIRRVHLFPKTSKIEYFKKTSGWYLRYRKWTGK